MTPKQNAPVMPFGDNTKLYENGAEIKHKKLEFSLPLTDMIGAFQIISLQGPAL